MADSPSEAREREDDSAFNAAARVVMDAVVDSIPEKWRDDIRSFWDPRPVVLALLLPSGTRVYRRIDQSTPKSSPPIVGGDEQKERSNG